MDTLVDCFFCNGIGDGCSGCASTGLVSSRYRLTDSLRALLERTPDPLEIPPPPRLPAGWEATEANSRETWRPGCR